MDFVLVKRLLSALEKQKVRYTMRLQDRADAALLRERFSLKDE
jgi:hypothetical protein